MPSNCLLNSFGASLPQGLELGWWVCIFWEKAKDLYLQLGQLVERQSSLSAILTNSAASQHVFTKYRFPSKDLAKSSSIWLVDVVGMLGNDFINISLFIAVDGRYLVLDLSTARKGPLVGCGVVTLEGGPIAAQVDSGEAPPAIPAPTGGGVCVCTGVNIWLL